MVLDSRDLGFDLNSAAIKLLCHRNYGLGSDGILLLVPSDSADFGLRIFNPDGSEAEKSGNGLRIFAKYLYEHGHTQSESFRIETPGGIVTAELEIKDARAQYVTPEIGEASITSSQKPVSGDEREVVGERIGVAGETLTFTAVSVGNPHCVVFREKLDETEIRKLGPLLETHEMFPNRINVQFAKPVSRNRVETLIWERGAGYTLASGSSSCAVASASLRNGLTDGKVTVSMPGGDLDIEIRDDWSIKMRGAVEEVASGTLSSDLLARMHELSP